MSFLRFSIAMRTPRRPGRSIDFECSLHINMRRSFVLVLLRLCLNGFDAAELGECRKLDLQQNIFECFPSWIYNLPVWIFKQGIWTLPHHSECLCTHRHVGIKPIVRNEITPFRCLYVKKWVIHPLYVKRNLWLTCLDCWAEYKGSINSLSK